MKTVIITCDICGRPIQQNGWEDAPGLLVITTECTSQNPMARITKDSKFQGNTYQSEDVCQSCMKSLANTIANAIESLRM